MQNILVDKHTAEFIHIDLGEYGRASTGADNAQ